MDKCIPNATIRRVWLDTSLTTGEAADQIGLSRVRLWVRAKALGLPPRKDGRRPVIPDAELRILREANVRSSDIAGLYGCPVGSVRQASRRLGLPRRPLGHHRVVTLLAFRDSLLRRSMQPGEKLTDAERAILERMRLQ